MHHAVPDQVVVPLPDDDSMIGCDQVKSYQRTFDASDSQSQTR